MTKLVVLATNDLHGQLSPGKASFLSHYRDQADLYFDSGDAIKTGNLGLPIGPEPVWDRLAELRCDASCPGNRESHIIEAGRAAKFAGVNHPVLCCNWVRKDGSLVFPASLTLEVRAVRVGVIGVMVPMVTPRMTTAGLSAFLWSDPIETVGAEVAKMRPDHDLIVVLSHLGNRQDLGLAEAVDGIDLILGGHSHTVLNEPVLVRHTWICQAGSHAKLFGRYEWTMGSGLSEGTLIDWP